mgnify:CR=1 FL=1
MAKNTNNSNITKQHMFQIHQDWIGEGKIIHVKFEKGNYTHLTYEYNHDAVVNSCEPYLQENASVSWNNRRTYMNRRNIPGWAKDYVQIIES